jgi:RHS repeat-associated protein
MIAVAFRPATTTSATTTRYFLPDHLNSTNVVTDASGTPIQALDYYPYGSTRVNQQFGATFNEQKQYIGQYTDPETNLSYLQARYMNSTNGQFLSEDPVFLGDPRSQTLTEPQSLNSYSYANDNPITKEDPSGRFVPEAIVGAVAGSVIAVDLQAVEDLNSGHPSGLGTYFADAAGGAVAGGLIGLTDGASLLASMTLYGPAAGVAGGVTKNGVQQTIDTANGGKFNAGALFSDAPTNALFGAIPGMDEIPGTSLVMRNGLFPVVKTLYTKLARGTISGVSNSSLAKFVGAALLQQGPGAAAQSMTKMLWPQSTGGGSGNELVPVVCTKIPRR